MKRVKRTVSIVMVYLFMVSVMLVIAAPAFAVKGGFPNSDSGWGSGFKKLCSEAGGSYGKDKVDFVGENAPFASQTCLVQEGPPEE